MIEPPCTERYAWWCERSANQLMVSLLLDSVSYSSSDISGMSPGELSSDVFVDVSGILSGA